MLLRPPAGLALLATVVSLALVSTACSGPEEYAERLASGSGPANAMPLWPLGAGMLNAVRSGPDASRYEPSWPRQAVVSQRDTAQGRLVTIDVRAFDGYAFRRDTTGTGGVDLAERVILGRETADFLVTPAGDIVAVDPDGRRYLLVPATVRVGAKWRVVRPPFAGSIYNHSAFVDFAERRSRALGSGEFTFAVTGRDVEPGPTGDLVVWTIEATDGTVSAMWRFAEGRGPLTLDPSLAWSMPPRARDNAQLPLPLDAVIPLAGQAPLKLTSIGMTRVAAPPFTAHGDGVWGLFHGKSARFTWSSSERAAGHAAELVLLGEDYGESSLLDPNGQGIFDWVRGRVALCIAIDPATGDLVPLERLAGDCPDRDRLQDPADPARPYHAQGVAAPYVAPDGRWWVRGDAERATLAIGSAALPTQAPFMRDGVLHTLNCHGDLPTAPCELMAFPTLAPSLFASDSGGTITALPIWSSRPPGDIPMRGWLATLPEAPPYHPPTDVQRFAIGHDAGFIHVAAGFRQVVVRWFSLDGRLLDHRALPIWQPSLTHHDGRYRLLDVRPLGELYEYEVTPAGVRILALGRLAVPQGEHAEFAVALEGGRYLAVTSRPDGDGRESAAIIRTPYDSSVDASGLGPAVPDAAVRAFQIYVTSPVTAAPTPDALSAALGLPLWLTGEILSVCDAPEADPPLALERLRVGSDTFDLRARPRDARGCHHLVVPPAILAAARESALLPVGLAVAGLGEIARQVSVPPEAPPVRPSDVASLASLPGPLDSFPPSVRPVASNLYCGPPHDYRLSRCAYYPWGAPSAFFDEGEVDACDPATAPCIDFLAYTGDPAVLATHEPWVADADNPWAPGRADLFPAGRVYWLPRDRPAGPLVAADFERASPLDAASRHWRVDPDPAAWRIPDRPSSAVDVDGTWPAGLGVPVVEPPAFEPAPLLAGTGLTALPEPAQSWRLAGRQLDLYGPPISQWVLAVTAPTPHGHGIERRSGPLPTPDARALATDGAVVLWADGAIARLDGATVPQAEVCNGLDDDGDGQLDETGADGCPDADAVRTCHEGVCFRTGCAAGLAACDENPWRCDVPLATLDDCLACGDACPQYGGATCAASGCTPARLADVVAAGSRCWRRFHNGDVLDGERLEGPWAAIAGGSEHVCRLDAAGALSCECLLAEPSGTQCRGATSPSALSPPLSGPFDRVWAGAGSTCARVAATGAVHCWGSVTEVAQMGVHSGEIPELTGATAIAFGGASASSAYALVAGEVYAFGAVNVGAAPSWTIARVEGLPPASGLHAANGYALFETPQGVYGLGGLGRLPALGGPSTPRWDAPTRAPGLDGAVELVARDLGPCKRTATSIRCAYEPGVHGSAPPGWTKLAEPAWFELPGEFQRVAAGGARLCVALDDLAATVVAH